MAGESTLTIASFLALAPLLVFAGLTRGLTGFAGPIILVTALTFHYPPAVIVALVALIDLTANIKLLPMAMKKASYRVVMAMVVATVTTMPLGVYALLYFDPRWMAVAIFSIVAFFSLVLLSGVRYQRQPSLGVVACVGGINGVVTGATSLGITMVPFLYSGPESLSTSRATLIMCVLFNTTAVLGFLAVNGAIGQMIIMNAIAYAPLYVVGVWVGENMYMGFSERVVRTLILFMLFVLSVVGLVKSIAF